MSETTSDLGAIAKGIRQRKGYAQAEVAEAYSYSQGYISSLERGQRPSSETRAYIVFLSALSANNERASGGNLRVKRKANSDLRMRKSEAAFEVLTDRADIARARKLLRARIVKASSKPREMALGTKGGTGWDKVYYMPAVDIWTAFEHPDGEWLWNTYGIGDPFDGGSRDLVCHLSVPAEDINRRIGAVYARAKGSRATFILHRGRIGGGREGVGKSAFFEHYKGELVTALDGERVTEFALVGAVESASFLKDLAQFVHAVKKIKDTVTR
jgi:transcriptional regulator with XRE-family HTH domain